MQTETVDIEEAQAHFRDLLNRVVTGVHVMLCENRKTIAHLMPAGVRMAGLHAGDIETTQDFDAPLAERFWTDAQ